MSNEQFLLFRQAGSEQGLILPFSPMTPGYHFGARFSDLYVQQPARVDLGRLATFDSGLKNSEIPGGPFTTEANPSVAYSLIALARTFADADNHGLHRYLSTLNASKEQLTQERVFWNKFPLNVYGTLEEWDENRITLERFLQARGFDFSKIYPNGAATLEEVIAHADEVVEILRRAWTARAVVN